MRLPLVWFLLGMGWMLVGISGSSFWPSWIVAGYGLVGTLYMAFALYMWADGLGVKE